MGRLRRRVKWDGFLIPAPLPPRTKFKVFLKGIVNRWDTQNLLSVAAPWPVSGANESWPFRVLHQATNGQKLDYTDYSVVVKPGPMQDLSVAVLTPTKMPAMTLAGGLSLHREKEISAADFEYQFVFKAPSTTFDYRSELGEFTLDICLQWDPKKTTSWDQLVPSPDNKGFVFEFDVNEIFQSSVKPITDWFRHGDFVRIILRSSGILGERGLGSIKFGVRFGMFGKSETAFNLLANVYSSLRVTAHTLVSTIIPGDGSSATLVMQGGDLDDYEVVN